VFLHLLDLGGDVAGKGVSKLFLTIAAAFAGAERNRITRTPLRNAINRRHRAIRSESRSALTSMPHGSAETRPPMVF
jgi:hypothetical protein